MTRAPDPLRLIIIAFVMAIVALRIGYVLRHEVPRRELASAPKGTASLAGTVVDHEGHPMPDVPVALQMREFNTVRSADYYPPRGNVKSDKDGKFAFTQLPAGSYRLTGRFARTHMGFGQTSVMLRDGQSRDGLTIKIVPGATVEGDVYEEDGSKAAKKYVQLIRREFAFDEPRDYDMQIVPVDAQGHYRVTDLPAGDYAVMAGLDTVGVRRVFYPNATRLSDAAIVTVTADQVRTGIDLHAQKIAQAPITGVVTTTAGKPVTVVLDLMRFGRRGTHDRQLMTTSGGDGRFTFEAAPGDRYWIVAHSAMTASGTLSDGRESLWGVTEITTDGRRAATARLTVEPGLMITGKLSWQSLAGKVPPKGEDLRLRLAGRDNQSIAMLSTVALSSKVEQDGSFTIVGVPAGTFSFFRTFDWWLESLTINQQPAPDGKLVVTRGENLKDVTLSLVDRPAAVTGTLRTGGGEAIANRAVVVFADDARLWNPYSGRVQVAPSDADGVFSVVGLAAGQYLAAALDDGLDARWSDPATLERLRAGAVRLSLQTGEQKTQDLVAKR